MHRYGIVFCLASLVAADVTADALVPQAQPSYYSLETARVKAPVKQLSNKTSLAKFSNFQGKFFPIRPVKTMKPLAKPAAMQASSTPTAPMTSLAKAELPSLHTGSGKTVKPLSAEAARQILSIYAEAD